MAYFPKLIPFIKLIETIFSFYLHLRSLDLDNSDFEIPLGNQNWAAVWNDGKRWIKALSTVTGLSVFQVLTSLQNTKYNLKDIKFKFQRQTIPIGFWLVYCVFLSKVWNRLRYRCSKMLHRDYIPNLNVKTIACWI